MLNRLAIRNYALIAELDLEFGPGLTVITGETGSGKSIMLGALSLILGGRADSRVAAEGKSVVEAEFENVDPGLRPLFDEKGIDWQESAVSTGDVTVRREVSAKGRSRVFINDTSVTLATLGEIGPRLIDIHSQHGNARLGDPAEQMRVLDAFIGMEPQLADYRRTFKEFVRLHREIEAVKKRIEESRHNEAMMRMQYEQLDALKPKRGELEEIERRYEMLSDADEIKENLSTLSLMLGESESGLVNKLRDAMALMGKLDFSLFGENAEDAGLADRMEMIATELEDIAETVEDLNETVDTDPATLARLSERMRMYYDTVKRMRVRNADELEDLYERLRKELAEIEGGGEELPALEREAKGVAKELRKKADEISALRKKGGRELADAILQETKGLGLPNLKFEVRISDVKISSTGKDKVEFYCSFNKNGELQPLGKTASGGEMSRLMLSLKAVLALKMDMPTIIFDEVDTGVSGEIAERMGKMMHSMGKSMQVMAITHLPQVAARGDSHFKVYKTDEGERTVTHVRRLDEEGRRREIAAMIAGSEVTEAALKAAAELIGNLELGIGN